MPLDFKLWLLGPLLIPRSVEDVLESRGLSPFGGTGRNTLGGGQRMGVRRARKEYYPEAEGIGFLMNKPWAQAGN